MTAGRRPTGSPGDSGSFLDPQVVPADVHRRAVRGFVLDAAGRLLLEQVHLPTDPGQGTWWELPGGGMEPGEVADEALLREIAEETGLTGLEVGPPVATRRIRYRGRTGEIVEQHETFHLVDAGRARAGAVSPEIGEGETIADLAWFAPAELDRVRRADPAELVRKVGTAGRAPGLPGRPRSAAAAGASAVEEAGASAVEAAVEADGWLPERFADLDCVEWSDERDCVALNVAAAGAWLVDTDGQVAADLPAWRGSASTASSRPPVSERSGEPVRVVRDAAPWTPTVHAFLHHLADRGFDGAPRPLGVDACGREAVTFVAGVNHEPGADGEAVRWPEPLRTIDGMDAVGALLRDLRDAAAGFRPPRRSTWLTGVPSVGVPSDASAEGSAPGFATRGGSPVGQSRAVSTSATIAHGDIGWSNVVWRPDGRPALIDWEFAQPASPLRDLAQAACWLVPLVEFDHEARGFASPPDRRARLRALASGSGVDVDTVLDAVAGYLDQEVARIRAWGGAGVEPWAALLRRGSLTGFARVRSFLEDGGAAR